MSDPKGKTQGELRILQHNCNRSTNVMQGLMESGVKADVIAIQEPWVGKLERKRKVRGAVGLGNGQITVGSGNFDVIFRQHPTETGRVMWMVRRDKNIRYSVRNDIWDDRDGSVLDVTHGEETTRIINIYHQASQNGSTEWCLRRFPRNPCSGQKTILLGDFNAKAMAWDWRSEAIREEEVMRVVERNEMSVMNERDRVTWRRKGQEAVLDLAWISKNERGNWKILKEDTGSDHALIMVTIAVVEFRCDKALVRQFRKADWNAVQEGNRMEAGKRARAWRQAKADGDLEEEAAQIEGMLWGGVEAGVPTCKPC